MVVAMLFLSPSFLYLCCFVRKDFCGRIFVQDSLGRDWLRVMRAHSTPGKTGIIEISRSFTLALSEKGYLFVSVCDFSYSYAKSFVQAISVFKLQCCCY